MTVGNSSRTRAMREEDDDIGVGDEDPRGGDIEEEVDGPNLGTDVVPGADDDVGGTLDRPHRSNSTEAGRALTLTLSEKIRRPGMSITSPCCRKKSAPKIGLLTPANTKM